MTETEPEIVIAHDYLTQRGGAERVVLALHRMYPDAPIYTTLYDPDGTFPEFRDATVVTTPLNRVADFRKDHRKALPLLPLASSLLRVPGKIAVVSSSGWAHGFRFTGKTVVYCHTPARWVHLTEQYLGEPWWRSLKGIAVTAMKPFLRRWDHKAAERHERYLGNSTVVGQRIQDVYGMDEVDVVFPPHSVDTTGTQTPISGLDHLADGEGYLLVVSRLMPYKNVDQVILAAQETGQRLLVVGRGPEQERLEAIAGADTFFARDLSEAELRWAYAHATALVAASFEDFGITPLEASSWGLPTIALRAGGYLDSIEEDLNGVFIEGHDAGSISKGIRRALERQWDVAEIQAHADQFAEDRFAEQIHREVELLREHP